MRRPLLRVAPSYLAAVFTVDSAPASESFVFACASEHSIALFVFCAGLGLLSYSRVPKL